jgi:alcohol dehydrogenase
MGHDPDIRVPHVPGHELAGAIAAKGKLVSRWKVGDRVTVPFVCACGACRSCRSGNQQVCDHQLQPGFTHWGPSPSTLQSIARILIWSACLMS